MSDLRLPMWRVRTPVGRGMCLLLALCVIWADVGKVLAARDMWSDRRRAVHLARGTGASSPHGSKGGQLAAAFPTIGKGNPFPAPVPAGHAALPEWLGSAVGLSADVGESFPPTRGERRVLIHIQDLHEVEEAQRNTAAVLEQLASSLGGKKGLLVGLEGASGGFRTADFRALASPPILRESAHRLLKAGLLSGPEYFSLKTEHPVRLWGAEDAFSYEANIRALTDTFAGQSDDDRTVAQAVSKVEKLKTTVYSPALITLDRARAQYEEGGIGLAAYVRHLTEGALPGDVGPTLRRFKEAVDQESGLSFSRVASEQERLLEKLAPRLSESQVKQLMDVGVAHRWGRASFSRFYGVLKGVCAQHGVSLQDYPQFVSYSAYAEKAEGLNPTVLLKEVEALADRRFQELASSQAMVDLAAVSLEVRLIDKLNRFVLTPADFRALASRTESVRRWPERAAALDPDGTLRWPDLFPVMERHEKFYRWAEARNRPLVLNLLPLWTDDTPAVLVAGGYHAEGVRTVALAQGLGYISLLPRLTATGDLPPPLDSFRQDPDRPEWVFRGDRSALHNRLATAHVNSPFVGLFMGVIFGVAVLSAPGDSKAAVAHSVEPALHRLSQAAAAFHMKADGTILSVQNDPRGSIVRGTLVNHFITVRVPPGEKSENGDITVRRTSPSVLAVLFHPALGWLAEIRENVAALGSRLSERMKQSTQSAAVVLVGPLQRIGTILRMEFLVDLALKWDEKLQLAQERKSVATIFTLPSGMRKLSLARLAETHSVPMRPVWAGLLEDYIQPFSGKNILPNMPLTVRRMTTDAKSLAFEGILGSHPVKINFGFSNVPVLHENPTSDSLVQMLQSMDGTYHVWFQLPVVSNASQFLPRVMPRVLRTVASLLAGDSIEEADRKALFSPHELENFRDQWLHQLLPKLARLDNQILTTPAFPLRVPPALGESVPTWLLTPGMPLGAVAGSGALWVPSLGDPANDLGLANSLAAVPRDQTMASLDQQIATLKKTADFLAIRQDALWFWSIRKDPPDPWLSDVSVQILSFVGAEQGRSAAFERKGPSPVDVDSLNQDMVNSMKVRLMSLLQTLLNLWSLNGVHLNKWDSAALEELVSDMARVYVQGFLTGYLPVHSVRTSFERVARETPGQADFLAGGVFYFEESIIPPDELDPIAHYLMQHKNPENCRIMMIVSGGQSLEEMRTALVSRLERDFKGSPRLSGALDTVRALDGLSLVRASDVRDANKISMGAVLERVRMVWGRNVGMVNLFSKSREAFKMDDRGEIPWALYILVKGNLLELIGRSLAIKTLVTTHA
jgi:hypothetical protein